MCGAVAKIILTLFYDTFRPMRSSAVRLSQNCNLFGYGCGIICNPVLWNNR